MPFNSDIISIMYGLAGLYTLYSLYANRISFFDRVVTSSDINLAFMVAIFVLTPMGVLLHEAGHFFTAKAFGATQIEMHFRGYWGYVSYIKGPGFDMSKVIWVTAAGPVFSVLLACLSTAAAVTLPVRTILKRVLASFGAVSGIHILIVYPIIDLLSDMHGDFHSIYRSLPIPMAVLIGVVHALLVVLLFLSWKYPPTSDYLSSD